MAINQINDYCYTHEDTLDPLQWCLRFGLTWLRLCVGGVAGGLGHAPKTMWELYRN